MDSLLTPEKIAELRQFISTPAPAVNTFLTTIKSDGSPYIRQVSAFVEGWRLGTISNADNLKVTHLRRNPVATYLFVQQQPQFGAKNIWLQGRVEIVDDEAGVQEFLQRRAAATGRPVPQAEFKRVVIYTTPTFLRAEGFT
ncbi:MAG: pyridoxamine 5'-phosphate oxidase family protein, partial [Dehalococcoidia bacterium]|nr:pyridoxamine 5'-phosphate oxidase family protein [Dehalococcoidia bacterium]